MSNELSLIDLKIDSDNSSAELDKHPWKKSKYNTFQDNVNYPSNNSLKK